MSISLGFDGSNRTMPSISPWPVHKSWAWPDIHQYERSIIWAKKIATGKEMSPQDTLSWSFVSQMALWLCPAACFQPMWRTRSWIKKAQKEFLLKSALAWSTVCRYLMGQNVGLRVWPVRSSRGLATKPNLELRDLNFPPWSWTMTIAGLLKSFDGFCFLFEVLSSHRKIWISIDCTCSNQTGVDATEDG